MNNRELFFSEFDEKSFIKQVLEDQVKLLQGNFDKSRGEFSEHVARETIVNMSVPEIVQPLDESTSKIVYGPNRNKSHDMTANMIS